MASVVRVDPHSPDPALVRAAADAIAAGAIVAYPTDTFYGLGVDPRSHAAVDRLFAAKGRAAEMLVPLIAADLEQVETQVGWLSEQDRRLAERLWPGPISLVVDARPGLAPGVTGPDGTVAVRVPAVALARDMARAAGHPITATSANPSGAAAAVTADDVIAALGDRVALVVDGGRTPGVAPSTIVRVREGRAELVRAGVIPWSRVLELLQ